MPKTAESWSLTSTREKLIKIGAKVVTEVAVSRRQSCRSSSGYGRNLRQHDREFGSDATDEYGRGAP